MSKRRKDQSRKSRQQLLAHDTNQGNKVTSDGPTVTEVSQCHVVLCGSRTWNINGHRAAAHSPITIDVS